MANRGKPRAIDPTRNVLDLVTAAIQRQDDLRDAETRRLNELRAQKASFEKIIADMQVKAIDSTSTLVATQLLQIQNTFNERVRELERFRYESSGRGAGANAIWGYIVAGGSLIAAAFATAAYFLK